jgi:hypothetical protein
MNLFSSLKSMKESDQELDPDPDPLVRGTGLKYSSPDPHQNIMDPQHCSRCTLTTDKNLCG